MMLRRSPWLVAVAAAVAVVTVLAVTSLEDADVYWHVLIGQDILAHWRFTGDPSWTFAPADPSWVTTQWGSEVLMATLHHVAGWYGLTLMRLACALATITVLAFGMLRGDGSWGVRVAVFSLASLAVGINIQERPAALATVLLAVLGIWAFRVLHEGRWPRPWEPIALTWLWANLHGSWVLLPAVFGSLIVALLLDKTPWRTLLRPAITTVAAAGVGVLTPAGLHAFTAPAEVSAAASPFIEEWARTTIASAGSLILALLTAALICAWALRPEPVSRSVVLWVLLWLGFALLAFRNVLPVILLIGPLLATETACAYRSRRDPVAGSVASVIAAVLVLFAGVASAAAMLLTSPRLPDWTPQTAYAALGDGQPHRVLVDYDLSGQTLYLGGPNVQVAIDGRTDRYGADFLARYQDLMNVKPGWQDTLASLNPDRALLDRSAPLYEALTDRGWTTVTSTPGVALLKPPGVP